jgi:opacity protein-like surface antigen
MKKQILFIMAAMMLGITAQAQDGDRLVYEKGDNIFNAGFGLGYYGYGYSYVGRSTSFPALTANYELGIHEYFGVGPYAGYASWNYRSSGFDGGSSIFSVGARGSFHYSSLLNEALDFGIDDTKLDLYVTLIMGMTFFNNTGFLADNRYNSSRFDFGPVLGARYYFGKNFGVYVEGGRGALSYLTLGISLKM